MAGLPSCKRRGRGCGRHALRCRGDARYAASRLPRLIRQGAAWLLTVIIGDDHQGAGVCDLGSLGVVWCAACRLPRLTQQGGLLVCSALWALHTRVVLTTGEVLLVASVLSALTCCLPRMTVSGLPSSSTGAAAPFVIDWRVRRLLPAQTDYLGRLLGASLHW